MRSLTRFFSSSSSSSSAPKTTKKKKNVKRVSLSTGEVTNSASIPPDTEDTEMVIEIDENEKNVNGKWSWKHLGDDDPMRFVCSTGQSLVFPDPPIAEGWEFAGVW